ncbi:hybrid sensor histidine kinase/response regulator [Halomicroarcula sp. GCM10025709]|uniref:sensor histidine kinase n=1 Tax=Haloarcula TaxID=2237 RepID=UPI0024C36941|nr:hybrid sensor histidine kinase/response regulator [Halomicroarcula sp. YJ-61-S]
MTDASVLYVGRDRERAGTLPGEVTTAATLADAVSALDGVDCVVSEYDIGDDDGLELFEAVRERRPTVAFVLTPETGDSELASRAVDAGVTAFLPRDLPEYDRRLRERVSDLLSDEASETGQLFAKIVDGVGVGVALYAADGQFRYVNPTYADLLDQSPQSLLDTPVWEVNPTVDPDRFERYWASFAVGETRRAEATHRRSDGTELPVETHTTAITVGDRQYHVGTITDISDRVADRDALERQNERLEQFASAISHDLRNPLDVAMGRTTVLTEECDSEHLEAIAGALDRMDELITDVLTLAREGKQIQNGERVSLDRIAESAWGTVGTADATLSVGTLGDIEADPSRLQRLFENLFRNSLEHGRVDDAEITITVDRFDPEGSAGGFFVADDGVGFEDTDANAVFDQGFTTSETGTGFGLAIVESVAEAHGWTVRARPSETGGARIDVLGVEWC